MAYRQQMASDDIIGDVMDAHLISIACDHLARGRTHDYILRVNQRMTPSIIRFAAAEMRGPVSLASRRVLRRQHVMEDRYYRVSLEMQRNGVAHVVQATALALSGSTLKRWHGAEPARSATVDCVALARELGVRTMTASVPGRIRFTMPDLCIEALAIPHDESGIRRYMTTFTMEDGSRADIVVRDGAGLREALMILAKHWATGGHLPSDGADDGR